MAELSEDTHGLKSGAGAEPDNETRTNGAWTAVEAALLGLLSAKCPLNVIQIGANDGKWSDPLHRFLTTAADSTNVLLIEPQPEIADILARTYANRDSIQIFIGAVAHEPGDTVLYRVRPDLWERTALPWLKDAPSYRAPSGFASTVRQHVEDHITNLRWRATGEIVSLTEAVEDLVVPTKTFVELANDYSSLFPVDVLQVDVEGADDVLVLAALDNNWLPHIINFEICHLGPSRLASVRARLEASGYVLTVTGSDLLAVRTLQPAIGGLGN